MPNNLCQDPDTDVTEDGKDILTDADCDVIEEGYNNDESILGPMISVRPGQTMMVKLVNNIQGSLLEETDASTANGKLSAEEMALQNIAVVEIGAENGYFLYGQPAAGDGTNISDYIIQDIENMPGYDSSFDNTNLHFHGLNVVPHLFYPQGTNDPEAEWVTVKPDDEEQRCMCYNITLPENHSEGTYWYHVHRHGSASMQAWSGMAGFIKVEGGLDDQLAELNITRDVPLALYTLPLSETDLVNPENENATVATIGTFFSNKAESGMMQWLVNNDYNPTMEQMTGDIVRYRLLCAAVENMCSFTVVNTATNETVPLYNIASDGMTFDNAYAKDEIFMAGGMREDILIRFDTAGEYHASITGVTTVRYFDRGEQDAILMFFNVTDPSNNDNTSDGNADLDITALSFNPSQPKIDPISSEEITDMKYVNFGVNGMADTAPAPLYQINNRSYNMSKITDTIPIETSQVWHITNPDNAVHPFHLHVVPFQVMAVHTGYGPEDSTDDITAYNNYIKTSAMNPDHRWRDTVIIPAYGTVTIRIRFTNELDAKFAGKTVFHCHFLPHEDMGMITNIMLT
eukprot:CFRG3247T1